MRPIAPDVALLPIGHDLRPEFLDRLGEHVSGIVPQQFQSFVRITSQDLDARVVCVISDVEGARILDRAAKHGIPAEYISAAPFKTKLEGEAEARYIETLRRHEAEIIVLAGFMRIVKPALLAAYRTAEMTRAKPGGGD